MGKHDISVTKKSGRPRGRVRPETKTLRVPVMILEAVEGYIARQPEPRPSRSEMIRKILEDRLVHEGLIEAPQTGTKVAERIEMLEAKVASIPVSIEPSPEAAMNVMRKAVAENELVNLKGRQPGRKRKQPVSAST